MKYKERGLCLELTDCVNYASLVLLAHYFADLSAFDQLSISSYGGFPDPGQRRGVGS
jgi:hypothetical protein